MLHHHFLHVDNELVEYVTAGEPEYEEIIEEYEEEILVQEGAPEPPAADFADTMPAQEYDVHLRYRHFMETTYINISRVTDLLS